MRKIALLIIAVCSSVWGTVSSTAQTAHFLVPFTDLGLRSNIVRSVTLTPIARTLDTAGVIRLPDPITYGVGAHPEMTNGSVTFSNRLTGYAMRFDLSTAYSVYSYTSCVPTNVTGLVNVTDYGGVIVGMVSGIVNPFAFFNPQLNAQFSNSVAAIVAANIPVGIVTNNATGVTLSGTFSGNGDGLNKTNFQSGIVVSGGAVNTISVGTNGSNNGSVGFPDVETDWGIYKTGGNLRIANGATLGGITVSNNGDLRATAFIGNASTATTASNTPSGRALDGLIGAFTNATLTTSGSTTGTVSAANNVLNITIGSSNVVSGSGVTNFQSSVTLPNSYALQLPDVIRIVGGVYAVCNMTNSFRNSDGTAGYAGNAVVTNGADVHLIVSNVFKSLSGKSIVVDTSFSTPASDERNILSDNTAALPPYDKQTRNLTPWIRGSAAYSRKTTLDVLAGQNAQLESGLLTAPQSYSVITNLAAVSAAHGDAVVIATPFLNNTYYANITNGAAQGLAVSNYMAIVTNQTGYAVWDIYNYLWPFTATNTFANLPWTVDGYHPATYQWQLLATNLYNFLVTNTALIGRLQSPLPLAPQTNDFFQGFAVNGGYINRWNDTNFHIAFDYTTNAGVIAGVRTNGYVNCNLTVSNLLPCTSYFWRFDTRCSQSQNAGQRINIVTDYTVQQWDCVWSMMSPSTVNNGWANQANYLNNNNSICLGNYTGTGTAGGAWVSSGTFSDIVLTASGFFTTSTNITAVQVLVSPFSTNTGSTFISGHLWVAPARSRIAPY